MENQEFINSKINSGRKKKFKDKNLTHLSKFQIVDNIKNLKEENFKI